jgi:hypothetical protein
MSDELHRMEIDELQAEIAKLEAQLAEREWISVEDRLPREQGEYIVHRGFAEPTFSDFFNGEWIEVYRGQCCGETFTDVTHWMPLPEPPNE